MSSIKHFRTELKLKIEALESELNFLAERMTRGEIGSREVARTYKDRLMRRISRKLPARKAAATVLERCACFCEAHSVDHGESREIVSTRSRALAAMDVASLALDEATHAAVEAWLAENVAAHGVAPEAPGLASHTREP